MTTRSAVGSKKPKEKPKKKADKKPLPPFMLKGKDAKDAAVKNSGKKKPRNRGRH